MTGTKKRREGTIVDVALVGTIVGCAFLDLTLLSPTAASWISLDEPRVTTFLSGALVLLSLIISLGALAYIEGLKWVSDNYTGFVDSLQPMLLDPQLSAVKPSDLLKGTGIPLEKFDSYDDVFTDTEKTMKEINQTLQQAWTMLLIFSVPGMFFGLILAIGQTDLALLVALADFAVGGVVFFVTLVFFVSAAYTSRLGIREMNMALIRRAREVQRDSAAP